MQIERTQLVSDRAMPHLTATINSMRRRARATHLQLASEAGMNKNTVFNALHGRGRLQRTTARKLLVALAELVTIAEGRADGDAPCGARGQEAQR